MGGFTAPLPEPPCGVVNMPRTAPPIDRPKPPTPKAADHGPTNISLDGAFFSSHVTPSIRSDKAAFASRSAEDCDTDVISPSQALLRLSVARPRSVMGPDARPPTDILSASSMAACAPALSPISAICRIVRICSADSVPSAFSSSSTPFAGSANAVARRFAASGSVVPVAAAKSATESPRLLKICPLTPCTRLNSSMMERAADLVTPGTLFSSSTMLLMSATPATAARPVASRRVDSPAISASALLSLDMAMPSPTTAAAAMVNGLTSPST